MPRIKINDLPVMEDMSAQELKGIFGGGFFKFKLPTIKKPAPSKKPTTVAKKPAPVAAPGTLAIGGDYGGGSIGGAGKIPSYSGGGAAGPIMPGQLAIFLG